MQRPTVHRRASGLSAEGRRRGSTRIIGAKHGMEPVQTFAVSKE